MARTALVFQRFAICFWPVATILLIAYVVFAFGGTGGLTGGLLYGLLGALCAVVAGLAVWRARLFRWPSEAEAIAYVDDGTPGRPVSAWRDKQATSLEDPAARRLWELHRERVAKKAAAAKVHAPDLRLSKRDPWGIRLVALTLFVAALLFARSTPLGELNAAVGPEPGGLAAGPSYEAWAAPPAYTGKPVVYLSEVEQGDIIALPTGSEITIRVYGSAEAHGVEQSVSEGPAPLTAASEGIADARFSVTRSGELAILKGETALANWRVTALPDMAPSIELTEPPERTPDGAMELRFAAKDDYGVTGGSVEITLNLDAIDRRHGLVPDPVARETITLDLPMPFSGATTDFEEVLTEDLAKHPWANLPVTLTLTARDAAEQEGIDQPDTLDLPGRRFFEPMAGAVIEQRRDLLWSPDNATRVLQILKAVTHRPEEGFSSAKAYLMTRTAIRRLGYAMEDGLSETEIEDIAEFLWQAAILLEEGDLASAAERLRRAQERLEEAIRNGASDEEIAELMQELREAMDEYMRQLAREAQQNDQNMAEMQDENGMTMSQQDLQDMMDELQRLMEEGRMEEAQQMLEMLRQMMENMRMAQQQQGQGQQGEGQQLMQDLQETLRQQQDLSDESFQELQRQFQQQREQNRQGQQQGQQGQQQGQQGQQQGQQFGQQQGQQGQQGQGGQQQQRPGQGDQFSQQPGQNGPGGDRAEDLGRQQEALRQLLDELRNQMPGGSAPGEAAEEALRRAERSMGEARDDLEGGNIPDALDRQADAMDALRDGIQNLGEALREQQLANEENRGQFGDQNGPDTPAQDPLGRPLGSDGTIRSDESLLPGEDAVRRSRELLDEIRRRAGEQARPEGERDYLRRLLERF